MKRPEGCKPEKKNKFVCSKQKIKSNAGAGGEGDWGEWGDEGVEWGEVGKWGEVWANVLPLNDIARSPNLCAPAGAQSNVCLAVEWKKIKPKVALIVHSSCRSCGLNDTVKNTCTSPLFSPPSFSRKDGCEKDITKAHIS